MSNDQVTFALPKGRVLKEAIALFEKIGIVFPDIFDNSRKLIFESTDGRFRALIVRDRDVPTYVESGTSDVGVVGIDVLLEDDLNLYEMLDLGIGRCRLSVAKLAANTKDLSKLTHIRVATKFVKIAEKHFASKRQQAQIIKLYGSIELAPIVGLADAIVDLVSSGLTIKENGLVETETILEISARLIVNKASLKIKSEPISRLVEELARLTGNMK